MVVLGKHGNSGGGDGGGGGGGDFGVSGSERKGDKGNAEGAITDRAATCLRNNGICRNTELTYPTTRRGKMVRKTRRVRFPSKVHRSTAAHLSLSLFLTSPFLLNL